MLPFRVMALPSVSTAAQKPAVGQETAVSSPPRESTGCGTDQEPPFQVIARPAPSTATQNRSVAQETEVSSPPSRSAGLAADQTGRDQERPFQVNA